jgi:RNase P subunit RPR2
MKSQREVERQYKKLMQDVATNDFYKIDLTNRINCYVCSNCGSVTKTKDVDSGVTPFIHSCEKCGGEARSTMYRDAVPNQEPTQEWYRPTLEETIKLRKKPGLLEHILQGGLDVRKIKDKP